MKQKLYFLFCAGCIFALSFFMGCDNEMHVHNYNTDWATNATSHWYACYDCGATINQEPHSGGVATCLEEAKCERCGEKYGGLGEHAYVIENADDVYHWRECVCGLIDESSKAPHEGGIATCVGRARCTDCEREYGELGGHKHTLLVADETHHFWKCEYCKESIENKTLHYGGVADCENKAKCEICETPYGAYGEHVYNLDKQSETHTWKECVCGAIDEESKQELPQTPEPPQPPPTPENPETGEEGTTTPSAPQPPEQPETGEEGTTTPSAPQSPEQPETGGDNTDTGVDESIDTLQGEGTAENPYLLTANGRYRLEATSYADTFYLVYTTTNTGLTVSFEELKNVDDTSFRYGEDTYFMETVLPTNIRLSVGETYYFVFQPNAAGEVQFTFIVE